MAEHEDQNIHREQAADPQGNNSVGHSDVTGYQESGNNRGSETSRIAASNPRGKVRTSIEELRDHLRSRPTTGIPGHRKIDPSEVLLQAFLEGNFEVALIAAQELQSAYQEAILEAGKLRFNLNFGTSTCDNCEGLKAGPGVVATCFQIRRCDFQNVLEEGSSPRHLRILQRMTAE